MPLVAMLDGERLESFRSTAEEWTALRASYRGRQLLMTCGSAGIPKTSSRGIKFFAHKAKGDCAIHVGAPESAEHLQTKALLAEAARRAGWTATVEYVGPRGDWVADVLIERGGTRIALEAQWSAQTADEFNARTARYVAAGIQCRWFLGPRNRDRGLPGSYEVSGGHDNLMLVLPGPLFAPGHYTPLAEALDVLMAGEVRPYAEVWVQSWNVRYKKKICWGRDCGRWFSRWYIWSSDVVSRCGVPAVLWESLDIVYPWHPFASARIEQHLRDHVSRLTAPTDWPTPCKYEPRNSDPGGRTYVTAICPHCGRTQGDTYEFGGPHRWELQPLSVRLDSEARRDFPIEIDELKVQHLCADVGNGQCKPARSPQRASSDHERPSRRLHRRGV
jgi:competence protein CoiA